MLRESTDFLFIFVRTTGHLFDCDENRFLLQFSRHSYELKLAAPACAICRSAMSVG